MATRVWNDSEGPQVARMSKYVRYGVLAVLGIFALITFIGSWYTVPAGSVSVITRNGKVIGEAQPGLNFKVPMIDTAHDMSVKTQRADFDGIAAYSSDIQQATNFVSVNYRLDPSVAQKIFATVGVNYQGTIMNGRVFKHVKEVFGKYKAVDIINKRDVMSNEIEAVLAEDMSQFGIVIEDVQIANIDFSDAYEHAAEQAATAQAQVVEAKQKLEKVKVETMAQVADAEAKATSTRLRADADAYAVTQAGNAEASAIEAKAKALAQNPNVIDYMAIGKGWDGVLPTTMVPGGTVPFLNALVQK